MHDKIYNNKFQLVKGHYICHKCSMRWLKLTKAIFCPLSAVSWRRLNKPGDDTLDPSF